MKNYISIDTIKNLLDSQLCYGFKVSEGTSPYRWNSITFFFYESDTEEEKAIKLDIIEAVKKLVSIYSKEEPTTIIVDDVIHHLYGSEWGYDGKDIAIKYVSREEEE